MPEHLTLNLEMVLVLSVLVITMYLFVSEIVRIDVAAVLVLVMLGVLAALPGLDTLLDINDLFSGFSSNAVISIIAIMIIGAGLDRTGVMTRVAGWITRHGGGTERRIVPLVSGTVGVISSFMQNVGAAALFLPVVSRIASRTGISLSRLLMPMGFCAILGGTLTMVGSSPLILLNDLIASINSGLSPQQQMHTFELFDVTPIGLALVACGIIYFILLGRWVLPADGSSQASRGRSMLAYLKRVYGLEVNLYEIEVARDSPLLGKELGELEREYEVRIIASLFKNNLRIAPLLIGVKLEAPATIAVMATRENLQRFLEAGQMHQRMGLWAFADALAPVHSGVAELVIPPDSNLIGQTAREIRFRKTYGLSLLAIHRSTENIQENVSLLPFQAGDSLVCHTTWQSLTQLRNNRDFVIVTTDYPHEELRPRKVGFALLFFVIAISLVLLSNMQLSLCLLIGAIGMIISGVLTMDEAYEAVSWKTVFLLASLIPLGLAVQTTGTAQWIAQQVLSMLGDVSTWVLQAVVAVLATGFTLVMSNVGATVLLVPLAVNIALAAGADPALFALTVAIATSNSFLIPTHQVNALLMAPGGYRVIDFMRAGGIMTILFLVVSLIMLNVVF